MGDRGFRASRLFAISSEERANLAPNAGSARGCKRGSRWCLFSKWKNISTSEAGKLVEKNVMECQIDMNHIPTKQRSETVINPEGSGPYWTAVESFGSTLDSLVEGSAHQAGEDINGRFFTGNEEFIPGDDEAYEDVEVRLEEVSRGMDPTVAECLRDLVVNHGCRIISVHPDTIEVEEGLARDVIRKERTMGEPINRDPICPCFLHPALAFIPSFSVVRKLVEIKFQEGAGSEAATLAARISRNIENNRGNLRKLLEDPTEMAAWVTIKQMIIKRFIDKVKKGK